MKRADLIDMIEAALAARQATYARQCAQRYLAEWPGDLGVQFVLARACAAEGDAALAVRVLEALTLADPEDYPAQRLLGDQLSLVKSAAFAAHAYACAHVGDGLGAPAGVPLPGWAAPTRAALIAERTGDWETARKESQRALADETPTPLPSLLHLCSLWHAGLLDLALPLAEGFHARWPRVIAFKLCLAECLLQSGDQARAIQLLHDAAAQDLTGQVPARHWGHGHAYRSLWASDMGELSALPGPLPADLIAALGLNRLPGKVAPARPKQSAPAPAPIPPDVPDIATDMQADEAELAEDIADIKAQLDAVARSLRDNDGRRTAPSGEPHYIILSSHTRLLQVFGREGFKTIDKTLAGLAARITAKGDFRAHVLYVDDPLSLKPFGLRPVNPGSAWDIKMLLGDLAGHLKRRRGAIGAVLIVGGDEIVPFHRLPNPTDDVDDDIPSDNPYATADENYFVPEWPVGRIPSGAGRQADPLLRALRLAASHYQTPKAMRGAFSWLARLWQWFAGRAGLPGHQKSFGYSANVWKDASLAVYTAIGRPRDLLTSPPLDANALPVEGLAPSQLSYFNLHGIEDGPEWYGQRRASDPKRLPEYPVALRPSDVVNSGRAPAVVFSEACYGANIAGKTAEDALCLRFLESGSRAMVGSTKIAYGSVAPPLIGADLLGWYFWQNVRAGLPVGEALRRAKVQMAKDMHERQGFLDGEDQKTLISFVLYGDPVYAAPALRRPKSPKGAVRLSAPPAMVCDRADGEGEITPEAVAHVKSVVERYLPGMQDAEWRVAYAHASCSAANHDCPTAHLAKTVKAPKLASRPTVVTLSKTFQAEARAHPHFARLTLDERGKVVKVAVSR